MIGDPQERYRKTQSECLEPSDFQVPGFETPMKPQLLSNFSELRADLSARLFMS